MIIYAFYIKEDYSHDTNMSYHFTKKGAYQAMLKEMKKQAYNWYEMRFICGKGRKGSCHNIGIIDWKLWKTFGVREIEIKN